MRDCEVRDFVQHPDGSQVLRMQNEAANVELARRGQPELQEPSGEVPPDAIWWAIWCGGLDTGSGWLQEPV